MKVLHYYLPINENLFTVKKKFKKIRQACDLIENVWMEECFNIEIHKELTLIEVENLKRILPNCNENSTLKIKTDSSSNLSNNENINISFEIGPKINFLSPFSSNAVSICHSVGLVSVNRIEKSIRYLVRLKKFQKEENLQNFREKITDVLIDSMVECVYPDGISSFELDNVNLKSWYIIDVIREGKRSLQNINEELGLALDEWDINFYTDLFCNKIKRNPTNVEIFDLAQSNSEHSRHWFFKGDLNINGNDINTSLFEIVQDTQNYSNNNNVIKFDDNSSAISGFSVQKLQPKVIGEPSEFEVISSKLHLTFTAETHNFPTAVCPFSGAATGTGGRIRDIQAVGRGGSTMAGTVGYAVGNLLIPDYDLVWEDKNFSYPKSFAKPLEILIDGSNGCSDYGNKFGEPVICGFTRSFGLKINNQRKEYIKPILFSGGIGTVDDKNTKKEKPKKNMNVIKIGGPVYRIGIGGGSSSSLQIQEVSKKKDLYVHAVQRGDPEMEQKLNRFIRSCTECPPDKNPILSIHDQGAGGNGNVIKELVDPEGAIIFSEAFELGDPSVNILELWGAEYQESNAILCEADSEVTSMLKKISRRERCPLNIVGTITGNSRIVLKEGKSSVEECIQDTSTVDEKISYPINLDLKLVLGNIPKKKFYLERKLFPTYCVHLPENLLLWEALGRVLRHPTVCSKRFLTNKVDRSVTGLIAQQQCVGPLHTPVCDVAVTAISYFDLCGTATSIGEQPIKSLVDPVAGAKMCVAEAISNLVFAKITSLKDVKCSANWMWPAKLPGEGVRLFDSCVAMCSLMKNLNIAVDGGKDSLSMATRTENNEIVMSPGTLVISAYAPCPDIRKVVTPNLKLPWQKSKGYLLHIDVSNGQYRLGGSILNQCFTQIGQPVPNIENANVLKQAFNITQELIQKDKIISGHDVSDGGLITCLIEMAISGMTGVRISIKTDYIKKKHLLEKLFAEECGWVVECNEEYVHYITKYFIKHGVKCSQIGYTETTGMNSKVSILYEDETILEADLHTLTLIWEETSYRIERKQMNTFCAEQEYRSFRERIGLFYDSPNPFILTSAIKTNNNIKVAVIREEGINGDREMIAALFAAGFEVWDITMQDLFDEKITIDVFRGLIFPGGFSYADVFGAAKGWAASLLLNKKLWKQFDIFYHRDDTFSFGVCNGCQLMCLIGWIDGPKNVRDFTSAVRLKTNISGRFESRFCTVKIYKSPAIMLRNMEDSVLGVWVAHGEGRFELSSDDVKQYFIDYNCIPLRYVNDKNECTEEYPFNPNGSPGGIAGICSVNGRHLAFMPHPERCIKFWQWPYVPAQYEKKLKYLPDTSNLFSPWFQIFLNAFEWCCKNT